jgi:5-(hydroxymethyl)furfural/furfural oxidase
VHAFAQERQIAFIADMNGDFRDGYGAVPMSNWPSKRASSAICYLDASVRGRSNLTIISGASATGFTFDGRRVTGVVARIGGEERQFRAREVILSTGSIHSPAFLLRSGIGPAAQLRQLGIEVRADLRGVGENLSNHAIVFVGLLQRAHARQAVSLRPHPMTALRYSSGLPGAPPTDMYINVQCKTSWSALGLQVANLAPTLLKPMARGRVTLTGRGAEHPCVEFNFVGEELDLRRFMQGFRRAVEILAHAKVRAMCGITFPVKFTDRLRRLNRITPANKLKSAILATLIDGAATARWSDLFGRSPIGASIPPRWSRMMLRWRSTSATMSPACSIPSAPAGWDARTIPTRWSMPPDAFAASTGSASSMPRSCRACRAAIPTFRPSWSRKKSQRRCSTRRAPPHERAFPA